MQDYTDSYYNIPIAAGFHCDDETLMELRFGIGDFVFKVFCLFYE